VNFTYLKNEVTDLGMGTEIISTFDVGGNNTTTRTVVGEPIAYFYGYQTDGIFQTQEEIDNAPDHGMVSAGDRRFKDLNDDGIIDDLDRTNLGSGIPKYMYGFNIGFEYKGFDFSLFLNGNAGVDIINNNLRYLYNLRNFNGTGVQNVLQKVYEERWTGPGTSNTFPKVAYNPANTNIIFSDSYVENGSFVRLRNIQAGYTLPSALFGKSGIKSMRIYISGQNLLTFTKYQGYDPEVGGVGLLGTGIDQGRYPVARMYSMGLKITL
jgi:hypothetical protein